MKRFGRLKRKSRKRAAHDESVWPMREVYRFMFIFCQCCHRTYATDIHEITAGNKRKAALGERALLLSVCRKCHEILQGMPHVKQLKIKMLADPEGYDLAVYRRVMRGSDGREAVVLTQEDVDAA